MLNQIKHFFLPPKFEGDENKTERAKVIHYLLIASIIVTFLGFFACITLYAEKTANAIFVTISFAVLLSIYFFNKRGYFRLVAFSYLIAFWSLSTIMLYFGSGVKSPELGLYIVLTVLAGVMLGVRWASVLATLSGLVVLTFAILEIHGYQLPHYFPEAPLVRWFNFSLFLFLTIMPIHLILSGLSNALRKAEEENKFRKQAEQAIISSEKYFRALIENSQDIITVLDPDGNINFESPSNERLLGYASEELIGQNIFNFIFPEDREVALDMIHQCLNEPREYHTAEFRIKHKDDSERHLDVIGQSLLHSEVNGVILNLRDITEKKIMERQFRQVEKMESIGRLAGGVVHDFNNILSTILGYSDILLSDMDENDPNRESVEVISNAGKQAAILTRKLLAFSRKQLLSKEVVYLNEIIKEFLKILSKILGNDINLITHLNAETDIIEADPVQIEQILMNLTINAKDAMKGKGDIVIETKEIEFTKDYLGSHIGLSPGKYIMLAVTDTGSGISKEIIDRIFEPFFTTKAIDKGTGLGLATVYGITKQHKGEIYVYSEKGKGTTFKIYLPIFEEQINKNLLHHKKVSLKRGTETILIVDNEESIRNSIIQTLTPLGYKCLEASNAQLALKIFENNHNSIDLILTDVEMPDMKGDELVKEIKSKNIKCGVVYMSGYTEKTHINKEIKGNGKPYLSKPINPIYLTQKLREVLDT